MTFKCIDALYKLGRTKMNFLYFKIKPTATPTGNNQSYLVILNPESTLTVQIEINTRAPVFTLIYLVFITFFSI